MKKIQNQKLWLRTIIYVLVICTITGKLSAEGYDSTYVLAVKQKFAIPEDVRNGDQIGIWKKTYTWNSGKTITYSIKTNYNSAFSINQSSGLITVVNANNINGKIKQQDTVINLIVRSTDAGLGYEDDTCEIRVKEKNYCKFIDYSYAGTKSGTRDKPYSNLSEMTVSAGYGYFIKRSNIVSKKSYDIAGFQATVKNPTIIGAYGTGNNPLFDGAGLAAGAEALDFKNTPSPSKFCYLYNIDVQNYPSIAFAVRTRNSNFGFYNCNFNKNVLVDYRGDLADIYIFGSAADTLKNWGHELINLESKGTWGPILKTDASGVSAYNIKSQTGCSLEFLAFNFRFAVSYFSKLSHFVFIGGERSLQARYPYITITDGIITGSSEAGMFLQTGVSYNGKLHNLRIKNVLFRNNDNGIYTYNTMIDKLTIENCRFESNKYDGLYFHNGGKDRVIQNCSFINNGNDGIELLNSGQASTNLAVYYNLFSGNKAKAINAVNKACANGVKFYNNTIIGAVDISGVSNATVRNNFYLSLTGSATASNNITLGSINQSTYFKNPAAKDYRLISTASSAIDKGYLVGLSYDCLKITISGAPDIGAYEYKAQSQSAINNAPVLNNQSFTIQEANFSSNIGTVTASDLDEGQKLTYAIISGNENGYFSMDPNSGTISATSSDLFSGDISSIVLTVEVTDNATTPVSAVSNVTITLVGKDIAIVNTSPSISNQSFNINEEDFSENYIGMVEASDIDAGQELSYSIVSGNENNVFSINEKTGELTTTTTEVFNGSSVSHTLAIEVSDNAIDKKSTTAQVIVDFIAKTITSTETITASTTLNVYPNPSQGNVNVEINTAGINSDSRNTETSILEIVDLAGKTVISKTIEDSESLVEENFDLSNLPNGLYSVRVKMTNQVATKKLILNR